MWTLAFGFFASSGLATTWNPLDKNPLVTLSNGNLTAKGNGGVRANASRTAGKYFYQVVIGGSAASSWYIGVSNNVTMPVGKTMVAWGASSIGVSQAGAVWCNSTNLGTAFTGCVVGDVIDIAVDIANNKFYVRKNGGAWGASGNPAAGTGGYTYTAGGAMYPARSCNNTATEHTARFLSDSWSTVAPTGYGAWV